MRVVVLGNGIVANLAALHLHQTLANEVELSVIGPASRGGMPVVGESTIEITAQFLERLGLGSYLASNHYPKYGLTYYFKLNPNDPTDRAYSVQCNERDPVDLDPLPCWDSPMARPPSWQLNRDVFDADIRRMVSEAGISRVLGVVSGIDVGGNDSDGRHRLEVKLEAGGVETIEADWVIDATGRRQFLARRLGLTQKTSEKQRNVFWFRLANFQRKHLKALTAHGPMPAAEGQPYHHDRYFTTHHFMGKGNWIWLIPLRAPDGSELISVGLSSRPDVYPYKVKNIEDFLEHVVKEHPLITDLVRSGTVLDTNTFSNYRYVIKQAYSENRWAIIGDAAFAPDPLFSNGLAFSTIQIEQVGAMIARDVAGVHSREYIEALERVFWTPVIGSQNTIADWYETMDDPLLCAARLNFIEVSYFYWILPLIMNRCHVHPDRLQEWAFLQAAEGKPLHLPYKLTAARQKVAAVTPDAFIYHGKKKVNLQALRVYENLEDMRAQAREGAALLSRYTDELVDVWKKAAHQGPAPENEQRSVGALSQRPVS